MPFTGKPSTGCQTCRTRRIKCDETKPTCNRCAKAKRVCTGYRDSTTLLFRNQNLSLGKRRPQIAEPAPSRLPTPEDVDVEDIEEIYRFPDSTGELERLQYIQTYDLNPRVTSLQPALEQQALHKFLADYVVYTPQRTMRIYLDILLDLYLQEPVDSPVYLAVSAASLANYGNFTNDREIRSQARRAYGKALAKTNKCLQDRDKALANETLMAVHTLSLYETMMCTTRTSWVRHVRGLAVMLRSRGPGILKDPVGVRIFPLVRAQILIDAMDGDTSIIDFREPQWTVHIYSPHPANGVMHFLAQLPPLISWVDSKLRRPYGKIEELCHHPEDKLPASPLRGRPLCKCHHTPIVTDSQTLQEEISAAITALYHLDAQLLSWARTLPSCWDFTTHVSLTPLDPQLFWKDTYHLYNDVWTAFLWNGYRVGRMTIHRLLSVLGCTDSLQTIIDVCDELCYSVPFSFSYCPNQEHVQPVALGGHFLLWPLAAATNCPQLSKKQRVWLNGRLDYTADRAGVKFAKFLKNWDVEVSPWPAVTD